MKFLEGSWRFLKVPGGLKDLEGYWWFLKVLEVYWRFWKVFKGSWRSLTNLESSWLLLKVFVGSWRFSEVLDELGGFERVHGCSWKVLEGIGGYLRFLEVCEVIKVLEVSWSFLKALEVPWRLLKVLLVLFDFIGLHFKQAHLVYNHILEILRAFHTIYFLHLRVIRGYFVVNVPSGMTSWQAGWMCLSTKTYPEQVQQNKKD